MLINDASTKIALNFSNWIPWKWGHYSEKKHLINDTIQKGGKRWRALICRNVSNSKNHLNGKPHRACCKTIPFRGIGKRVSLTQYIVTPKYRVSQTKKLKYMHFKAIIVHIRTISEKGTYCFTSRVCSITNKNQNKNDKGFTRKMTWGFPSLFPQIK